MIPLAVIGTCQSHTTTELAHGRGENILAIDQRLCSQTHFVSAFNRPGNVLQ